MTETESSTGAGADDDQVLLERLAKREERRQKRMKEAMERQRELDPTIGDTNGMDSTLEEQSAISSSSRERHSQEVEEEEEKPAKEEVADTDTNSWRKEEEETKEDEKVNRKMSENIPVYLSLRSHTSCSLCLFGFFSLDRNRLRNQEQQQQMRYGVILCFRCLLT